LHDAKNLIVGMSVLSLRMGSPAHCMETQPSMDDILIWNQIGRNVFWTFRMQIGELEPFHGYLLSDRLVVRASGSPGLEDVFVPGFPDGIRRSRSASAALR
jgi:hypothetical protein